jgi:hypothetical protein
MDTYTNKLERMKKTFSFIEPDRIPIFEIFWLEFLKSWRKEKGFGEDADIYEYYDMDMVLVAPNTDPQIESFKLIEKNENYIIFKSGFGCTIKKADYCPMPQFIDFSIKSANDYDKFKLEDPNDNRRYFQESANIISSPGHIVVPSFDEQIKKYENKIPLCGSVCEGMEKSWRIRSMEGVFMDLLTDRDRFKKFLKRLEDFEIQVGINQIKMGCDFMIIAGDIAYDKGMFFSPETWREVFKPYLYNMCAAFKETKPGIKIIYHGCGNATAVFDDLIECGVDAYHPLEVKAGIDIIDLKKKYKNKMAFIGNIDCRDTFPGSKRNLRRELLRKLSAAKGGGYIPSADHSIPANVPVENYDYFIRFLRKYGKYPLKL